ncbi:MAG TPA: methyltransferase domain-containing protein [Gemmatimonadaceae bacterium]|nr:methyltransferase domain-containing protein [Gemmatimonadaceae bacterium]
MTQHATRDALDGARDATALARPGRAPLELTANLDVDRYRWAEACLRELRPTVPRPVVSDVGCGDATMRPHAERLGWRWQGFDLAPRDGAVRRWDVDQPAPPHAERAGLALMLEVLEHLGNPWRAMAHVADHLLPGGCLVLTTPNPRWSRSRMAALASGVPTCFTQRDLDVNGHVFAVWPHVLERLLLDVGLGLERYVTLEGRAPLPRGPLDHRYPVRFGLWLALRAIERRDPTACGMAYGVIARKPG